MKIRTIAPIAVATTAGALLTRVPWPSAEQLRSGLLRFAADAERGARAVAFEAGLWIDRGRVALERQELLAGTGSDAPWFGSTGVWAVATAAAALLVFGVMLALALWRRRAARAAAAGAPLAAAAGTGIGTLRLGRPRARAATTDPGRGSRARQVGTDPVLRLGQARSLAAAGRVSADVARESALSRDAVELLLRMAPRPDAISGTGVRTGRSFRGAAARRARAARWPFSAN